MKALILSLLLVPFPLTVHAKESWWRVFGEIKLGNFAGGHIDGEKPVSAELKTFLATREFDEWETYEDELVRFTYPKHPLLKLEVNKGEGGIEVEGGVCTTVDNSFRQAYVLKAGETTYGVFLVAKANWLDDGICFCGPMVHHVYRIENKCLVRFSLLPGGAVKKAQVLGGKLRLMSFEWTHLGCPVEIYEEMVERMELKVTHSLGAKRLREKVYQRYGLSGRAGWLHPGMSLAEADRVMGSMSEVVEGLRVWGGIQDDYPCHLRAAFEDGRLKRLETEGVRRAGLPAVRETLSWVEDELDRLEEEARGEDADDPFGSEDDGGEDAAPPQTVTPLEELTEASVKLAGSVPPADWFRCLLLMNRLSDEHGVRDERLVRAIVNRGEGHPVELEVLVRFDYPELMSWVEEALDRLGGRKPSVEEPASPFSSPEDDCAGMVSALLEWLAAKDAAKAETKARSLLATGEAAWTIGMLDCVESLPAALAQDVVSGALRLAMKRRSGGMIEDVFGALPGLTLPRPNEILKLIDALPAGEPDSEWEKNKAEARTALKAPE